MSSEPTVTTYEVQTIQQAVEIGTTLTGHWFRGHPELYGNLTPSVFRQSLLDRVSLPPEISDRARAVEGHMADGFRLKAPAVYRDLPGRHDLLGWLFLMQHHGTPTRLLDWSENALVALYFAVRDAQDRDGELWAMSPVHLALAGGMPGLPVHDSIPIARLAANALSREPEYVAQRFGEIIDDEDLTPLPLFPPLSFPRMVAQSSTFTIHPAPSNGNSITELLNDEQQLVRYLIRSRSKVQLQHDLSALCINEFVLFPDLDGLSVYLRRHAETPHCQLVPPPRWPVRSSREGR